MNATAEYLDSAPVDVRAPRITTDGPWTFITHSCADYGPIIELEEYVGGMFRTARYVVSMIGIGDRGYLMMDGVRLTAAGVPDRRAISSRGGMCTSPIRGFRNQIRVVGFHAGTWGRA